MAALIVTYAPYLIAAVYLAGAIHHLIGPKSMKDTYVSWGYPRWFNYVTGMLEAVAFGLILWLPYRPVGISLGAAIMAAAVATLVWNRAYKQLPPALIILALSGLWWFVQ